MFYRGPKEINEVVVTPMEELKTPMNEVGNWLFPCAKVRCLTDYWEKCAALKPNAFPKFPENGKVYTVLNVNEHPRKPGWFGIRLAEIGVSMSLDVYDVFPVRSSYDIAVAWFEPASSEDE